jgi:hypothetical protein
MKKEEVVKTKGFKCGDKRKRARHQDELAD